ncbi:Thermostable carboxypeptidase 1 [Planctomycetes bacterium Pan216]|uniref:Metal-dependent carboxypeptidase n=1 Tax=Kolteria novifilia TaxID=2527975 RepID=A0A518B3F0_9BACT|nr:Thermostable carboxypeptidase 1 [Planctomycetes bacterium Pan216]
MDARTSYDELINLSKQTALLASCEALLSWEQQTYMPPGGVEHRGNQLALLAGMIHEQRTDPKIGDLLGELEASDLTGKPDAVEAVNIRELRRVYDRATKLPRALVEEFAKTTTVAERCWAEARVKDNFPAFEPHLARIIDLSRQMAECYGYESSPYDALMDSYEPGATCEQVTALFGRIKEGLVPLVASIIASPKQPDESIVRRNYPVDRQEILGEAAAAAIGFDFQKGRLDRTAHPFCSTIGPGDIRLTTRYNPVYFNDSFFSILHEAGHGLYEQGLLEEHFGTPMGEAVSLGIHESQSRLWENAVGRSHSFWRHFYPRTRQVFHATLHDVALEDFHFAINRVKPSLVRVDADEVTYNLHVLIRFEVEQAMLSGDLPIADVPAAWNQKYQDYLGVTPPSSKDGCLQDVHWSIGAIGYFPTYTLGNVYAAQLMNQAEESLGSLDELYAAGEFHPLLTWLREQVHAHGQCYRSAELVERVTKKAPDETALLESLRSKFGQLYDL